jgi:hypothetical protein
MITARPSARGPSGPPRRHLAAALLVVYGLAVWALPFAHAVLLDGASGPAAHVERQGPQNHREAHDTLDCVIFSVARLLGAAVQPVPVPDGGRAVTTHVPVAPERHALGAVRGAYSSRAPPLA